MILDINHAFQGGKDKGCIFIGGEKVIVPNMLDQI
jgi:hypothetical protein